MKSTRLVWSVFAVLLAAVASGEDRPFSRIYLTCRMAKENPLAYKLGEKIR